uniref:Subtelomeric hrmA-associated cluster protein AFUB-079030/YDR124W-like helical bundle domain-containing protein n=1 Tax=Pyricularia oryzae (strain P131) TaxID=1143193 RepID=L7IX25_PYRO1
MGRDYPEQSGKAYYRGQQWDEERTHTTTLAGNYADHGRHGVYFDDGRQAAYAENGRYPGYPDDGRSNAYDDNGRHAWYADNGRYQHLTGSMPIDMALREHCRIPVKRYFLAVQTDDGKMLYMHSQHKLDERDVFNRMGFDALVPERDPRRRNFEAHEYDAYGALGHRGTYARLGHTYDGPDADAWEEGGYVSGPPKARKRHRAQANFRGGPDSATGDSDLTSANTPVPQHRGIVMADHQVIMEFCETRFKNLQQMACKIVAKAWVKLVEPKKQSNHPYTNGDINAPDWWPKPWGPGKDEKVRHKEPDHLWKRGTGFRSIATLSVGREGGGGPEDADTDWIITERIYLLNHILQLIVQPNHKQHPDIQKLKLNVAKLEEATAEALSSFFLDKENPGNARRKVYLKEIFKVAKAQERFLNGEVDGDYKVWVNADDKFTEEMQSGDDHITGTMNQSEEDMRQVQMGRGSAPPSQQSPLKSTMMQPGFPPHGLPSAAGPSGDHTPPPMAHGGGGGEQFLGGVPVRTMNDMPSYQAQEMYPGLSGSRRSSSIYGLTTDYAPGGASGVAALHGMYTAQWSHQGPASATTPTSATGNPAINFAFTSQPQTLPLPAPFVTQAAVQASQHATAAPGAAYMPFAPDSLPKVESASVGGALHSPDGQHASSHHQSHTMNLARHPLPTAPGIMNHAPANYPEYGAHESRHMPRPLS